MRRRQVERSLALGIAIEFAIVIGFSAVMLAPRWRMLPFAPGPISQYSQAGAFNPAGTALLTEDFHRFAVVAPDGSMVLPENDGISPVWIDDRTLLTEVAAGQTGGGDSMDQLIRVDTQNGHRDAIGEPLPHGFLSSDGRGHVAHRAADGPLMTRVLDPVDGHVVAQRSGFHPITWTQDGALIIGELAPRVEGFGLIPQRLYSWRPDEEPRRIGRDLLSVGDTVPMSPSGDAVACVCVVASLLPGVTRAEMYRIPLDGAAPASMGAWQEPAAMAWIDDRTLAIIDDAGLARVSVAGARESVSGLQAADLGFADMIGTPFRFGDGILVIARGRTDDTGATLVAVVDATNRIRMHRRLDIGYPHVAIDTARKRAVINTGPVMGRVVTFSILEYR